MEVEEKDSVESLVSLANNQFDQGRFREAEESYSKAIEMLKAACTEVPQSEPSSSPDSSQSPSVRHETRHLLATCLSKMGDALFARNEPEKALQCYKEALPILDLLFGEAHPEVMAMIYKMELVLDRIGADEPDGKRVQWNTGSIPALKAIEKASGIHQTVPPIEKSEIREKTKKSREERKASLQAAFHSGFVRNALFFFLQFLCALVVMSSYVILMQWYEHKKIDIGLDNGPAAESFQLSDGSMRLILRRDGTVLFDNLASGSMPYVTASRLNDALRILPGAVLNKEWWFERSQGVLRSEDGWTLYETAAQEQQIIRQMDSLAHFAERFFAEHHEFPTAETADAKQLQYKNPFTTRTDSPSLQELSVRDVAAAESLAASLGKGAHWDKEPETYPGSIDCLSLTIKADPAQKYFFIRGCDRQRGALAGNQPGRAHILTLVNGFVKPKESRMPKFLEISSARPKRICIIEQSSVPFIVLRYGLAVLFGAVTVLSGVLALTLGKAKQSMLQGVHDACVTVFRLFLSLFIFSIVLYVLT